VAASNLTTSPFEIWHILGREIKVETSAEIVAKKLWHRGHTATARDLFDLALVIEKDSENLKTAAEYLKKHGQTFLSQLESRQQILEAQFNAINTLNYKPTFKESFESAKAFLNKL
jgi:predicted nucleotidyltransferase component of viral defense system